MADLTKILKDATYVSIGFGVLAFQKVQVQRRELRKQFEAQLTETRDQVQKLAKEVEQRFEPVLDQFEERLPDQAKDLVKQAREAAKDVQDQLLSLVNRTNSRTTAAAA